ncbi:hypothetical protein H5410_045940 [Solanum commersonii]|uniref:Nardilysin-like n=1 Tax=Solanum commersonii TaxID=4109 RepID=A0A9J5XCQ1_SOLCO|nr:hypothetical protein H5410_045940 [Solanum commersonii]
MKDTFRQSTYASCAYGCKKLIDIYCCIAQLFQMSRSLLFLASTGLCHKASKKPMNAEGNPRCFDGIPTSRAFLKPEHLIVVKFLYSAEWEEFFKNNKQMVMPRVTSDHFPILLQCDGFRELVHKWWNEFEVIGCLDYVLSLKLRMLKKKITEWSKLVCGGLDTKKRNLLAELADIDLVQDTRALNEDEMIVRATVLVDLEKLAKNEEARWRQKSRVLWLQQGDNNTNFFQRMATAHKRYNAIDKLVIRGEEIKDPDQIKVSMIEFYKNLYSESEGWRPAFGIANCPRISQEDQEWLQRPFTEVEVLGIIKQCDGDKAPGPNGFTINILKYKIGNGEKTNFWNKLWIGEENLKTTFPDIGSQEDWWRSIPACIWWTLWRERNDRGHDGIASSSQNIKMRSLSLLYFWCKQDIVGRIDNVQQEPWFGSEYVEKDIPSSLFELWKDPTEINACLHLPSKNEFVPSDFSIHAGKAKCDSENARPRCILDELLMRIWYKLDNTFKLPRANTYFRITLKGGYSNLKNALLTELFIHLLKDELNEIIYQASVAKLETSVSLYGDKLELKVYGFNDKLPVLLSKVLGMTKSFLPRDDRFMVIKEDMVRTLKNTNMKPLNHSSYLRLQVLCQSFWDVEEKLFLLNDLTLSDLNFFIPELLSQLYIEGLCHGNLLEEEALNISKIFRSNFSVQPLPFEMRHKEYVMCLPTAADLIKDVRVKNKLETNSVVELYFQIEPEEGTALIKLKAVIDLFDELVEEPLFNQLRTKEQLGYVVDCSARVTYRITGFCFRVQSSDYDPVYLQGRIENFINGVEELGGKSYDLTESKSCLETWYDWVESSKSYMRRMVLKEATAIKGRTFKSWRGRYISTNICCSLKFNKYGRFILVITVNGQTRAVIIMPENKFHEGLSGLGTSSENFIIQEYKVQ